MKKSKSTKTSKSNQSSFTGTSPRGDLNEAFRKAKESFQAAGLGNTLDKISVMIIFPIARHKDDPPGSHPNKGLTGTSPRGRLEEAFRKAKEKFQAARPGQLSKVSVTIRVNRKRRRL
jgi:hypothetical protein